jgi:hypothetical protein
MMLTGENFSNQRKSCPTATLSTTNLAWTGLELNLALCTDSQGTNCHNHGMTTTDLSLPYPLRYKIQYSKNSYSIKTRHVCFDTRIIFKPFLYSECRKIQPFLFYVLKYQHTHRQQTISWNWKACEAATESLTAETKNQW